ncbi:hypothetical protein NLX71_03910 [Paenibacillus sp. MZ04-78.2]|uniref:hypothetical protein n=1 Tax=Paenibacillus sp. MZ04-78.2 TaxID=2962034 RepID=UPI0020B82E0F|nr:hypothetical protein [Paenibacillus sp. MZ04-78.2]MCP3772462.1 hypothetical protein [Paenibacillus sp. MZ04-78.2]
MKRWLQAASLLLVCALLGGCMYPKEMRKESQIASGEYVIVVQNAVDQFKAKTGVLPIKNFEATTPLYEQYLIDFKKLKGRYISEVPLNAFENGGTATYVLIDAETKPTVKMMDLPSFQQTVELQQEVDRYKSKTGTLPTGEAIAPGFFAIDYAKLNRKPLEVTSMYTRSVKLPFLMSEAGQVAIDYAPEMMRLIDKKQLQSRLDAKQDLRALLVQESYFVPARSFAYMWKDNKPVPVPESF